MIFLVYSYLMKSEIKCSYCGKLTKKENSAIGRAKKSNSPMYCNRNCSSESRKISKEEKIEKKRLYDLSYRERLDYRKRKSESFKRNYDPVKAAAKRKENMHKHAEYCRKPEYVIKKKQYDRVRRAKIKYGDLWEIHLLTMQIQDECLTRMTRYQINLESQTLNKKQRRKRNEQRLNSEQP